MSTVMAPADFCDNFNFAGRLRDVLGWALVCRRLTVEETLFIEACLDQERRLAVAEQLRVHQLVDYLLGRAA